MLTQAGASPWKIAVIGAGPAGLALALQAARWLPHADISLFDARAADQDISADPRTLPLAFSASYSAASFLFYYLRPCCVVS